MADTSRRRTPKIGYSYTSKQPRHGPAPLASFEDMPSDDQASPEDEQRDLSPDQFVIDRALDFDSFDLLSTSPTKTLTPVSDHSPEPYFCPRPEPGTKLWAGRKHSATCSQQTLTPVGALSPESARDNGFSQTPSGSRSGSAHSQDGVRDLRKSSQGSQLIVPGDGDGAASKSPSPTTKRKGSWTDMFFKGRSRSKSPNDKGSQRESPQNSPSGNEREGSGKRKKSIFSFLSKSRKSSSATDDVVQKEGLSLSPETTSSPSHAAAWKQVQQLHHQPTASQEDHANAWKQVQQLHRADFDGREPTATASVKCGQQVNNQPKPVRDESIAAAWKQLQRLHHHPTSQEDHAIAWRQVQELHHRATTDEIETAAATTDGQLVIGQPTYTSDSESVAEAWRTLQRLHHQPTSEENHAAAWRQVKLLHRGASDEEIECMVSTIGQVHVNEQRAFDENMAAAWKSLQLHHHQPSAQENHAIAWKQVQDLHHEPSLEEIHAIVVKAVPELHCLPVSKEDHAKAWKIVQQLHHQSNSVEDHAAAWKKVQDFHHQPSAQELESQAAWKTIQGIHHQERELSAREKAWKTIQEQHHQPGPEQVAEQAAWRTVAELHHQDSETNPCRRLETPRVSVTDTSNVQVDGGQLELKSESLEVQEGEHKDDEQDINEFLLKRSDTDDEVQSQCNRIHASPRKSAGVQNTVVVTIERRPDCEKGDNSSESDTCTTTENCTMAGNRDQDTSCTSDTTHEYDTEAANLLAQESVDYEENSSYDSHEFKRPLPPPSHHLVARDRRQELAKLAPVDRPRSTTPIGVAPLQEFIRRASLSPDPTAERIKMSLPGEQFLASARSKEPRKSNPQIWLDFCEKGLQSPKTSSRKEQFKYSQIGGEVEFGGQEAVCGTISVSISPHDAFTPLTDTPLTPVTPLGEEVVGKWNSFGDSFDPTAILAKLANNTTVPAECTKCDCGMGTLKGQASSYGGSRATSQASLGSPTDPHEDGTDTESLLPLSSLSLGLNTTSLLCVGTSEEKQCLVSPIPCSCDCHSCAELLASGLWRKASLHKQESVSSDISSASSRLLGSSSSINSLKCTPDDALCPSRLIAS